MPNAQSRGPAPNPQQVMSDPNDSAFLARLGCFKSAWKRGLTFALVMRLAAWAIALATLYYATDFFLALDESVRGWLNILLPAGLAAAMAPEAIRIARLGMSAAAERVDRIGGHRRKDVLTAWELGYPMPETVSCGRHGGRPSSPGEDEPSESFGGAGSVPTGSALPAFLIQRSVSEAMARLALLDPRALRPRDLTARRVRLLGLCVLLALGVVAFLGTDVLFTVGPRLLWPGRDIPPYSRYRFAVRPEAPTILYGGAAEVAVTIRGMPVNDQVWLLTRRAGQKARRAACFQEGGGRYAQRLENVTVPLEFCFAVGRARSRWHRVEVQLQPQVVLTRVRLVPPAYTRLPVREFPAGQEDVAGVRGSRVTLTLTSNRPLKDGAATVLPRRTSATGEQVIEGRLVSDRSVAFAWTLEGDAEVKATLRDVRGTPTAEPLAMHQRFVPDEPPKVVLTDPPEFCMATPTAALKVEGAVEDDFGIEQIDWIRSLVGFNDRGVTLRRGAAGTRFEFDAELNLAALGVEVGQVLEFYAEALDNNPYLSGVGASGVARVKVIGENEYAEMIRNREAIEQFMARYEAAMQALNKVIESLEELQGQVLWRNPDKARLAATVKKALDAHNAAEAVYGQLARDFAAYDSEKTLKKTAGEILEKLAQNKAELEAMREPGPGNTAKAEGMLKRLGAEAKSLMRQGIDAALALKLAKVMDSAARFQAVVRRQETLVRWLKQRYGAKVAAADLPFLPGYGENQGEIAQALAEFVTNATAAAAALPEEMGKLKSDVEDFLAALAESGASNHMGQAVSACRNTDAPRACREAQLALEKLQSLIQDRSSACTNAFAGMCRGQQPDFGPGDMKKTLREMFRALCRKRGVGEGQGEGIGGAGEGGEGSGSGSEGGYSALSTPVYGPERSSVGPPAGESTGEAGEGRGAGPGGAGREPAVVERLPGVKGAAPSGEAVPFERLPAKYRDAVKRYFQNGKEGGAP
jgi:hypothetical protein